MQNKFIFIYLLFTSFFIIHCAPIVQSTINKSRIGFLVLFHNDTSPCSLHKNSNPLNKNNTIDALSTFKKEFLLIRNDPKKPSLILRPKYYLDSTGKKLAFLDDKNNFDMQKIKTAFMAWKNDMIKNKKRNTKNKTIKNIPTPKNQSINKNAKPRIKKRRFVNEQEWFAKWVGQDITIIPDSCEVIGYVCNKSRAHISNSIKEHGQWLSYSQGVFAHLIVEIEIYQDRKRGIYPILKVISGEGGICSNGEIEHI